MEDTQRQQLLSRLAEASADLDRERGILGVCRVITEVLEPLGLQPILV